MGSKPKEPSPRTEGCPGIHPALDCSGSTPEGQASIETATSVFWGSLPDGTARSASCVDVLAMRRPALANAVEQVVSPVSNPCSDMPLKLLLERWGSTVTFPEPQCPLWVLLTPAHAVVTPRNGCCLFERQTRAVLQQKLHCECTSFFIFCWSRACLPSGDAIQWNSVDHWTSLPCPGSGENTDCIGRTP